MYVIIIINHCLTKTGKFSFRECGNSIDVYNGDPNVEHVLPCCGHELCYGTGFNHFHSLPVGVEVPLGFQAVIVAIVLNVELYYNPVFPADTLRSPLLLRPHRKTCAWG